MEYIQLRKEGTFYFTMENPQLEQQSGGSQALSGHLSENVTGGPVSFQGVQKKVFVL